MSDTSRRKQDQFIVRLPDGMRDRIKLAAEGNNRSMNAEIVATLERAYPPPKPKSSYEEIIEAVKEDGESRIIKEEGTEVHFSRLEDGRVILDIVDTRPVRDVD
ncbi:Arc family DNA-binding protein [Rhodobacteraceae bacterium F11138]|nr:Arc family DNA-binding protein [Rhodobacteraceae bacterium F11138]